MNKKQLKQMMQQAQAMQHQLEQDMEKLTVEGTSGGGMIRVAMDGKKNLQSVTIDPATVDPQDVEMLQDLILAAVNEACRKVDEALNAQLGGLSGGMFPGM